MTTAIAAPELRILSLGWGVQSFTLAAMMALDEMPRADLLIHADTTHEHAGTYDFVRRWTPWLGEHGLDVVTVTGGRTDVVVDEWSNSVMIPAFTTATPSSGLPFPLPVRVSAGFFETGLSGKTRIQTFPPRFT